MHSEIRHATSNVYEHIDPSPRVKVPGIANVESIIPAQLYRDRLAGIISGIRQNINHQIPPKKAQVVFLEWLGNHYQFLETRAMNERTKKTSAEKTNLLERSMSLKDEMLLVSASAPP